MENYNFNQAFFYENGYNLTTSHYRLGRLLAHYELYKKVKDISGSIVECGVFRGASLMRFIKFVKLFEQEANQRSIIGFDTFGFFPGTEYEADKKELNVFIEETDGGQSISKDELEVYIKGQEFANYQLVKGDILETVPNYLVENPNLEIALLNIDTDIYEPCKTILEHLAPRVVKGGIIVFDDYGVFNGETELADEYAAKYGFEILSFDFTKVPSYLIKK